MIYVECKNCGWIHFSRTLAEVVKEREDFLTYYFSDYENNKEFFGPARLDIEDYLHCFRCGVDYYMTVPASKKALDACYGCTIQPILHFSEALPK